MAAAPTGRLPKERVDRLRRLFAAVKSDNIPAALNILQRDPGLINAPAPEGSGDTVLFRAINNVEVMKALLCAGADVKYSNRDGGTCLHAAVRANRPDAVSFLMINGADATLKDMGETAPLDLVLLKFRSETTTATDMIRLLAKHGANLNFSVAFLQRALENNDPAILATLVELGADLSPLVHSILEESSIRRHKEPHPNKLSVAERLKLLVRYGADLNRRDENGNTPLHAAVTRGHIECVTILLNAGVNTDVRNNDQHTPLSLLLVRKDTVVNAYASLPLLLSGGADPDLPFSNGDRPLHCAARDSATASVRWLLQAGANPKLRNSAGKLPSEVTADRDIRASFSVPLTKLP